MASASLITLSPNVRLNNINTWSSKNKRKFKVIKPKSSFPVFIVKNINAVKSFYTENLDFEVVFMGD